MRNRHFLFLDIILLAALPFFSVALRFESFSWPPDYLRAVIIYASLVLPMRIGIAYGAGLYRCLWRHASIEELQRLLYAGLAAAVCSAIIGTIGLTGTGLSRVRLTYIALALDAILAIAVLAGPRLLDRLVGARRRGHNGGQRAIVVGAGTAGQMILRETQLSEKLHVRVVAFVDDDPHKQRQLLGNVPVAGTLDDLPTVIRRLDAHELIVAIPTARGSVVRKVVQAAADSGIPTRTIPGLNDLISGRVKVDALRAVEIQDLLRREPVVTDLAAVRELATGRVVMVTGAGGSIGAELCRQIAELDPSALITLDHSENQIFEIHSELKKRFPRLAIVPVIADIRHAARLHGITNRFRPHAVFHAAAHKHVPLMEDNIIEAITNNIQGTRNVLDAALDAGAEHLVNISTDKAVRPTSVMGATKRIAEKLVLAAARAENRNFVSVRFGNVLGSRGSVIPTFLNQITRGGPITVTHPEMRRYFMTIPEAVQLVLQAGALGSGGELFVLDMGEPVKIVDLARDLIRLSGLEEGVDIEINFTGVRPGEKLYEEVLFGSEDIRPTNHPKVLRALGDQVEPDIGDRVEALIRTAVSPASSEDSILDLLREMVPEFSHDNVTIASKSRPSSPVAIEAVLKRPSIA